MNVQGKLLYIGVGSIVVSKMLKFYLKFLCNGKDTVRQAVLYTDRFYYFLLNYATFIIMFTCCFFEYRR